MSGSTASCSHDLPNVALPLAPSFRIQFGELLSLAQLQQDTLRGGGGTPHPYSASHAVESQLFDLNRTGVPDT
jgi:hypothetical protein